MSNVIGTSADTNTPAVSGENAAGIGVRGTSKSGSGVIGTSTSGVGVWGGSQSSSGVGGMSGSGIGVHGVSKAGPGVRGDAENGTGVFGGSKTSTAVGGISDSGIGVHGISTSADGVFGNSEKGRGVVGVAKNATGVEGNSTSDAGVYGSSQTGIGVHGKGGRLGGLFEGNVEITGNLTIQGVSIQLWLQRIARLEQEVISLRHQLATHAHAGGGSSSQSLATIHVEIDLSGFSQSFAIRRVSGGGFKSNEAIVIKTTSEGVTTESSANARSDGTYQQELSVPKSTPPKQYSAWAEGTSSGRITSKKGYSV
ncbi:MAG: hypothetical protein ACUBOA_08505 [Candidatus Loosdrechtia sp.]|uniref:hypothetical protein n=1 Tax=Candidatus Loosdrechtia sp. TaxID=3101272 RepID=UPI003A61F4E5|nr:MAG: hypothetical protein QY305_08765 [Candidatus Jettenia sp. AMX2]